MRRHIYLKQKVVFWNLIQNKSSPINGLSNRLSRKVDQIEFADRETFFKIIFCYFYYFRLQRYVSPWFDQFQYQFWPQHRRVWAGRGCLACQCRWWCLRTQRISFHEDYPRCCCCSTLVACHQTLKQRLMYKEKKTHKNPLFTELRPLVLDSYYKDWLKIC